MKFFTFISLSSKKQLLTTFIVFLFSLMGISISAQTTVNYAQRVANYDAGAVFTAGTAGIFNSGTNQLGMFANGAGTKQVVAWRTLKTAGNNTGSNRSLRVGDEFRISVSAHTAFGEMGFALLSSPTTRGSYANRLENAAVSIRLSNYGNWFVTSSDGTTQNSVTSTGSANIGGTTSYRNFIFTCVLTAPNRMNITINEGSNNSFLFDVILNSSNPITEYSIFGSDLFNGSSHNDIFWNTNSGADADYVRNTLSMPIGSSNGSFTISDILPNGNEANSTSTASVNTLNKSGTGTLTLSNASNSYSGGTIISGGTISISNAAQIGDASGAVRIGNGSTTTTLNVTSSLSRNAISVVDASSAGVINVASGQTFTLTNLNTASGTNNATKIGKSGAGTLTLSGAGNYVGQTQIGEGVVILSNNNGLGTNGSILARGIDLGLNVGDVSQGNNVSVVATTGISVPQSIYVAPNTSSATRTIGLSGASGTATFSNEIYMDGSLTVAGTGTVVLGGRLTNTGGLIATATTTTLTNTANNFTGTTTIQSGSELRLNPTGNATYTSQVVLNGGTLSSTGITSTRTWTNSSTLNVTANSTIALASGVDHTLRFANSSGVSWTAGATVTITGWSGIYNGTSNGTTGKIFVGTLATHLTAAQLSRIIFTDGTNTCSAVLLSTGELVPSGIFYWGGSGTWTAANTWSSTSGGTLNRTWATGGTAIFNVPNSTVTNVTTNFASIIANENVTFSPAGSAGNQGSIATIFVASGKTLDFASQGFFTTSGTGFIKNGPGTMISSNGNLYNGGFTLNGGTVAITTNTLGSGTLTINGGAITANSGTARTPAIGGLVVNSDFRFGDLTNVAAGTGNLTFTAGIALGSSITRTITLGNTGIYSLNGIISGTSSNLVLAATAAGTLSLGGANTYTGSTTINGGTLRLGAAGVIADASNVVLGGGTLRTGATTGNSETVGTLNLTASTASTIAFGTGNHTLTFANSSGLSPWGAGATLVVTGWTGTAGATGTAGKLFIGANNTTEALTAAQLAKISFTGYAGAAIQLSTGEVVPAAVPTIATTGTLVAVSTTYGTATATPAQFTVSGTTMTEGILVTPPSTNFEVSLTAGSGYADTITLGAAGTIASTTVFVRLKATATVAASPYAGNIVLTSAGATNVNVATVSSTVTPKALTISGITADNKIYDGLTTATLTGTPDYVGLANGETFTVTVTATASFADATVADGKTVTVTGYTAPSTNYTVTQPSLTANITAAPLTITGVDSTDKVYNGDAIGSLTGTAAYNGLQNGETFSVTGTAVATFAQSAVGTSIDVTVTGYTAPTSNYTVSQPSVANRDITAKPLTITGLTADNKVQDGNNTATLSGTPVLNGVIAADVSNVTLGGTYTATFPQTTIGTGLAVTVTGYTISGAAAGNYSLTQPTGLTADITSSATPVINSSLTASGTYGTIFTTYTITASNTPTSFNATGLPAGLSVNTTTGEITGTPTVVGSFNVTIIATNTGGSGNATLVIDIAQKTLTVSGATADNKIYTRTDAATISGSTLVGIVGGDVVTISNTGTFASVTVGTGIVVTSTQTIGGTDASKYILTFPTGLTADITAKELTVSGATVTPKVYDGLNPATITAASLVSIVSPDVVTVSGNGIFVSTDVANGISVTPSLSLAGADAGNYTLTQPTFIGNITAAPLTITGLTGDNRVYDATNGATLSGTAAYSGLQNGETFSVTGTPTATFANKNIGTGKAITVTGYTAPSSNYSVTQPTGLTANITVAPLTITGATATNRAYNATTTVTVGGTLSGILLSDVVTLNATGTMVDANVGTGKAVTFSIAGADATNYSLTQPSTTVDITQASQTITFGTLPAKTTADVPFSAGATSVTSGVNALAYTSLNTLVATINATTGLITIVGAGTTTITVSQPGNSNYTAATSVQQILTVTLAPVSIFANTITGSTPNLSNPYTTGQTFNSNITVSGIGRGTGISGATANDRYNANGWDSVAFDANDYFTLTLTPSVGYLINFENLVFNSQASGSGPTSFAVRSSLDSFGSNIATPTASGGTVSLSNVTYDNITTAITYRIYGWGASSAGGTYSINDFIFNGNVVCIQPAAYNVTGGGAYCSGGTGVAVGLANSQAGINYQLVRDGLTNVGSPMAGTGSAISFGNQTTAGTYTLVASNTNGSCNLTTNMTGSVVVTITPLNTIAAGTSQTVCINTAITTITLATTGATGATFAGLPAGVTGSWSADVVTIGGIPSESGTFNYTVTTTGGCLPATTSGTITVTPLNTIAAGTSQTVCINTAITTITLATTGATGVTFAGLPAGVTGSWSPDVVTISGIPTESGTFNYTVTTTGGCLPASTSGTITVIINTWIGTTTSWTTAGNWSCGIPTSTSDVVIASASFYPIISSDVSVNSLTINSTTSVIVNSGFDLTVTNAIVNNGTLTIENNANLLQTTNDTNTGSGSTIVKRNSSLLKRLDYTLWSSPVTGQGLYAFSKFTLPNRFYVYDTATDIYNNSVGFNLTGLQYPSPLVSPNGVDGTDNANVQFTNGIGYLIRVPYNHPTAPTVYNGIFTGVANNGPISATVSTALNGFNAVGNPYPSRLNVHNFIDGNTNITGPLYLWRKTNTAGVSTSYATLTKTAYVANGSAGGDTGAGFFPTGSGQEQNWVLNIGQGFIVKATSGSTVSFTNSMRRSLNENQFFRNSQTTSSSNNGLYWLNLIDNTGVYSQMAVGYSSEGTIADDRGIDGENINKEFYLTSLIGASEYSIQGRPEFDSSDVVPLSYKALTSGNYSIAIDHTDGLFTNTNQAIYLKDNLTATEHNLQTGAYNFTSEAGTFTNRFEITYQSQLSIENPTFNANQVIVYKNEVNDFVINSGTTIMASVKVFDIRGRLLLERNNINASQTTITVGMANEVLLVQITSEDGVAVTKKVVK